jgi:transcriptional regulator with XRE-family HTH domain
MRAGKVFEQFLVERKISQSEAARRLGVPRMTIWRWLYGDVEPNHFAKDAIRGKLGFSWPD